MKQKQDKNVKLITIPTPNKEKWLKNTFWEKKSENEISAPDRKLHSPGKVVGRGRGGGRERKEKLRKVGGWGEVGRVLLLLLITIKRNFLSASRLSLAAVYRQSLSKSSPLRPQLPVAAQATRILEFLCYHHLTPFLQNPTSSFISTSVLLRKIKN